MQKSITTLRGEGAIFFRILISSKDPKGGITLTKHLGKELSPSTGEERWGRSCAGWARNAERA
jgi:hypothetical protein